MSLPDSRGHFGRYGGRFVPEALQAAREEFARRAASGYVCPIEPGEEPKAI